MVKSTDNKKLYYSRYPEYRKHSIGVFYYNKEGLPQFKSLSYSYSAEKSMRDLILEFRGVIKEYGI